MLHFNVTYGITGNESIAQRLSALGSTKYTIGGQTVSLLDIEFNILRGSKELPAHVKGIFSSRIQTEQHLDHSSLIKPFASNDPRNAFIVASQDPRLTFALSSATKSSPLIHIYYSDKLFDELDTVTRHYLQKNIRVDNEKKEVTFITNSYNNDL